MRNLEIIGEASHQIEKRFPEFSQAHPGIPFSLAYQMRNAVAHGYFTVDYEVVWNTVRNDLRGFAEQVGQLKSTLLVQRFQDLPDLPATDLDRLRETIGESIDPSM